MAVFKTQVKISSVKWADGIFLWNPTAKVLWQHDHAEQKETSIRWLSVKAERPPPPASRETITWQHYTCHWSGYVRADQPRGGRYRGGSDPEFGAPDNNDEDMQMTL